MGDGEKEITTATNEVSKIIRLFFINFHLLKFLSKYYNYLFLQVCDDSLYCRPLTCSLELNNSLLSHYSYYNLLRLRLSSKGQGWRLLWGSARQSTRRYFSLRTSQEANLFKIGQPWASSFDPIVSLCPDASGRRQKSSIFVINI